jgi:hypothetical protein
MNAADLEDMIQTWIQIRQNIVEQRRNLGGPVNQQTTSAIEELMIDRDSDGGKLFF